MRKGKKIKRGRKGKHLGVLDILSAPNTHLGMEKHHEWDSLFSSNERAGAGCAHFWAADGSGDQMVDG